MYCLKPLARPTMGGESVAADFACEMIDPNNPTGPNIDAIFPGRYTQRL